MNDVDWLARWNEGRIGFHRPSVQPWLIEHVDRLLPRGDERIAKRVLVPLCGKSLDVAWLANRGHHVVGVELAELAIRALLAEAGVVAVESAPPRFHRFTAGAIDLWCGDFFDFADGRFDAIFDRAALIALPRELRPRYLARLLELLAPGGRILFVTLEYDERRMEGPPFTVAPDEVERALAGHGTLERLGSKSLLDEEPQWRGRGLDSIKESALLFTSSRRPSSHPAT